MIRYERLILVALTASELRNEVFDGGVKRNTEEKWKGKNEEEEERATQCQPVAMSTDKQKNILCLLPTEVAHNQTIKSIFLDFFYGSEFVYLFLTLPLNANQRNVDIEWIVSRLRFIWFW